MVGEKMTAQLGSRYGNFSIFNTGQANFGRYGYYIVGWTTDPDGAEIEYLPEQTVRYADISAHEVSSCVHMYALWKKNWYDVTARKIPEECQADIVGEGSYEYQTQATVSVGTDENYQFIAWVFPGGATMANPAEFQVLSSVQLTAKFKDLRTISLKSVYGINSVWRYVDLSPDAAGSLVYRYMDGNALCKPHQPFSEDTQLSAASALYGLSVIDDISAVAPYSFAECRNLTYAYCPTVKFLGEGAFTGNPQLQNIDMSGVISAESCSFEKCPQVVSAYFPELNAISERMFAGCSNLSGIYAEKALEIRSSAFIDCPELSALDLPAVSSFGNYIFSNGSAAAVQEIRCDDLAKIGEGAFYMCENLTAVDGIKNVEAIDDYAFYGCSKLKRVNFLSARAIGEKALSGCLQLTSIAMPNVSSIGNYAFAACPQLRIIDFGYDKDRLPPAVGNGIFDGLTSKVQCYVPYDFDTYMTWLTDQTWGSDLSDKAEIIRGRPPAT